MSIPSAFTFYLGTHRPTWLATMQTPLFVSRRVLMHRKTFPRSCGPWALDSGGFSELSLYGGWTTAPRTYVGDVQLYQREIGPMDFAAPQDWMCEPMMLAKTGLSVAEHQDRTVANYRELVQLAPDMPWLPVLQGWRREDYVRCVEMYDRAGVDLTQQERVGVGTLCRRQATTEAVGILAALCDLGLQLHGFGFKTSGLTRAQTFLRSADSMAWSLRARREPPLDGCTGHKACNNCRTYADQWRERIEARPVQLRLA